jgi:hypothetical protein
MIELRESNIKPDQLKPFLTSLSYDLVSVYKILEDDINDIIDKAKKEGYSADRLISEIGKLFDDDTQRTVKKSLDENKIIIQKLGTVGDITISQVDGLNVRNNLDINFTEGGHDFVYGYIPTGNIWIDNDVRDEEVIFIVIHEMIERLFMEGDYMTYDKAHEKATKVEEAARNDKSMLNNIIRNFGIKIKVGK